MAKIKVDQDLRITDKRGHVITIPRDQFVIETPDAPTRADAGDWKDEYDCVPNPKMGAGGCEVRLKPGRKEPQFRAIGAAARTDAECACRGDGPDIDAAQARNAQASRDAWKATNRDELLRNDAESKPVPDPYGSVSGPRPSESNAHELTFTESGGIAKAQERNAADGRDAWKASNREQLLNPRGRHPMGNVGR